ncbi:MAG TPA: hypothetical protein PLU17_11860 [Chitinophagaceae bacterium]|nr:hypothetical protein [Chitinophagaceae bacterium]
MHTPEIIQNNQILLIAYFIYLPIALLLTYYVARTLFKNALVFMLDIFHGKESIASSTNKLFEVGFYLLNIGFALLILRINEFVQNYQEMIEILSMKIGGFSIYLGIMLFLNMYMFFRGRKASKKPIAHLSDENLSLVNE